MNIKEEGNLIGPEGRPLFGIRRSPVESFNISDFRIYGISKKESLVKNLITRFRIKRWQYLGVCNDEVIFGAAIVNLGYMSSIFTYIFDRRKGVLKQIETILLSGKAALFTGSSRNGSASFKKRNRTIEFTNQPGNIHAKISADGTLKAELSFIKSEEPLCCTTRVGLGGFNYTHKEAGIPVRGFISIDGKRWEISEKESSGVIDYTFGYLARITFWNWAAGGGFDLSGNRIGFNLVQGVNETGFTENVFWINGHMIKTDVLDFRYSDLDLLKPWEIISNDGKINLLFYPEGERAADINTGLIASRFHQPFGRFEGRLTDGNDSWQLKNVTGFTEEHYAKW